MADGGKSPIGGTFETINEAVVKPVADEVGKAIEQGVQPIIGQTPKPTQPNQPPSTQPSSLKPTPQENSKLSEARRKIMWWKNLSDEQKRLQDTAKQKQAQAIRQTEEKKEIKQFEIVKKQNQDVALDQAVHKTERKSGVSG